MDILLWPHQSYVAVYLNDVVIHSYTWQEHVHQVLLKLRQAGLTANPQKCQLGLNKARYLG